MSVIEVDSFTSEVSAEAPSGPDVEYDPEYFDLEKLARGTPESQMGTETKPAEEPNWKDVREAALKLSGRTRDLRVALILTLALLKQDGLPGFRDGVGVLRGFVEKLWDHFYPKLDPDDNNDPTIRVNLLKNLNGDGSAADMYKFKQRLKEATLTKSAQRIGAFGLRDVQVAKGEVPAPAAAEGQPAPPTTELVDAAFQDTATEDLQALQGSAQESIDDLAAMDAAIGEKIGAGEGPDLSGLVDVLKEIKTLLDEQLARRGIGEAPAEGGAAETSPAAGEGAQLPREKPSPERLPAGTTLFGCWTRLLLTMRDMSRAARCPSL